MTLGTLGTGFGRLSFLSRRRKFDIVRDLFGDGQTGLYRDFLLKEGLYQTNDTSSPVTTDGQNVGRAEDQGPSNKDLTQSTIGARGLWKTTHLLCDGGDDHLLSNLVPATPLTLAVCAYTIGSGVIVGAAGALGVDRAYIRVNSNVLGGGIGDQIQTTITTGVNVNGTAFVAILRANGSTVKMSHNGGSQYSAAQVGVIQTTIPFAIGALNTTGGIVVNFGGRIYRVLILQDYLDDDLVLPTARALGEDVVSI